MQVHFTENKGRNIGLYWGWCPLSAGCPLNAGCLLNAGCPLNSGCPLNAGCLLNAGCPLNAECPLNTGFTVYYFVSLFQPLTDLRLFTNLFLSSSGRVSQGGPCSLVPFQNCPMFPCSHTLSECFRTVIFRNFVPCSQRLANVPLFPSIFCQCSLVPKNPWETLIRGLWYNLFTGHAAILH